jgi:hypothetical protein
VRELDRELTTEEKQWGQPGIRGLAYHGTDIRSGECRVQAFSEILY